MSASVLVNDSTSTNLVEQATQQVYGLLTAFATDNQFENKVTLAFGEGFNTEQLEALRQQWLVGDFDTFPPIEIRSSAELNGANGAFAAATNTIYLSTEYLEENEGNLEAISDVVLEEYGHFVDAQVNELDAAGDEGDIFAQFVQRIELDETAIQNLKVENDTATVTLDGQVIQIEQAENISGTITWKDSDNNSHPVRGATIKVVDNDSFGDIATTFTNLRGGYSTTIKEDQNFFLEVKAESQFHQVKQFLREDPNPPLFESVGTTNKQSFNIPNTDNSGLAFSINDAIYTAEQYALSVRGEVPQIPPEISPNQKLRVFFPSDSLDVSGYEYRTSGNTGGRMLITPEDSENWDLIHHEYGHFLADFDALDSRLDINENHDPGESNIAKYGKNAGVRLGWSEGLASYLGQAIQRVTAEERKLPNVPGVNDLVDTQAINRRVNIETHEGSANLGEGDETSVLRILWDLADPANELHDRIAIGHDKLYNILNNNISNLDRLDDVWDYFYNNPNEIRLPEFPKNISADAKRTKLGAIFEEYGVSPHLTEVTFGNQTVVPDNNKQLLNFQPNNSSLPTFKYQRGNNNANDKFEILIFDSDFQNILSPIPLVPTETDDVQWTPEPATWSQIVTTPGTYHIVIAGSDTVPGPGTENNNRDGSPETGSYWSGAYTFTVANEPPQRKVGLNPLQNINELANFQSKTNPIFANLPFLGNLLQSSSAASPTLQASQALAVNEVSEANAVAEGGGLQFLGHLGTKLSQTFAQLGNGTEATVEEIQTALLTLLGPNGEFGSQGILQDSDDAGTDPSKEDIAILIDGSVVQFNLTLGGQTQLAEIPWLPDIGLPGLGFNFNDSKASIDFGYTFNLGFGVDTATNEFFFDTSPTEDISISLIPSFPKAQANLGPLRLEATNKESKIEFSVDLDDGEDGDNQLTLDELSNLRFTPDGSADLNLHLVTSIEGSTKLPSIESDFNVSWSFLESGSTPDVSFNDVELNLGSFLSDFAKPILGNVQTITQPIEKITSFLQKPINLKVREFKPLDILEGLGVIDENDRKFINSVGQISTLITDISEITENSSLPPIKLGSFDLGGENILDSNFKLSSVTPNVNATAPSVEEQLPDNSKEETFIKTIPGKGLQFPILTDPTTAFGLLLGKDDVELLTYETPELSIGFEGELLKFPIIPPFLFGGLRGKFDATIQPIEFGYDTFGIKNNNLAQGFFITDTSDPEVSLSLGLEAFGELDAVLAKAKVGGDITGTIGFDLNGGDDNKVRLNDFKNLGSVFDLSGEITAGLNASVKVGLGWFSKTYRTSSPRVTLLSFGGDGDGGQTQPPPPILVTDLGNGVIQLNMGPLANQRENVSNKEDGAEIFTVQQKPDSEGNEIFSISAFGVTQEKSNVSKIIAEGGLEDDVIDLNPLELNGNNDPVPIAPVLVPAELSGDDGDDFLRGGNGSDVLDGGIGDDQLEGSDGNDLLKGGTGNDVLDGGNGEDTLQGNEDEDLLIGGAGADIIDGGDGDDIASYETANAPVLINLETGVFIGDADGDVLISIEQIDGSNQDDSLVGDSQNNALGGLDGNDTLRGGSGDDLLSGDGGADLLDGGDGENDAASYFRSEESVSVNLEENTGSGGDAQGDQFVSIEHLEGSGNADFLVGNAFNNILSGLSGDDQLDGRAGDDTLIGGTGENLLKGGSGRDTASYSSYAKILNTDDAENSANDEVENPTEGIGVYANLSEGIGQAGDDTEDVVFDQGNNNEVRFSDDLFDTFESIENLEGSIYNDTLSGDSSDNQLDGGEGDDSITGNAGNDLLIGREGNDFIDGEAGSDTVNYDNSPASVIVNIDETTNYDNPGGFLHETIVTDKLIPTDTEPEFTITAGSAVDGFETEDVLRNLENIVGSGYDDILIGNAANNQIQALNGNDILVGNAGDDSLDGGNDIDTASYRRDIASVFVNLEQNLANDGFGGTDNLNSIENVIGSAFDDNIIGDELDNIIHAGDGNDLVEARGGEDIVFGQAGVDTLYGEEGDDFLVGGEDGDILNGGNGKDTASYFTSAQGVTVSLDTEEGSGGDAEADQLTDIENLEGSEFEDILIGDGNDNILSGLAGNDLLQGQRGNDLLDGGEGDDTVEGGKDNDTLKGSQGMDILLGEKGDDVLEGGDGNDFLSGGKDKDLLDGGSGDDTLTGEKDQDVLEGGDGNDFLSGGKDEDTLNGGNGNDTLNGDDLEEDDSQKGNDLLNGGDGNDLLNGGKDEDTLNGGNGNDTLNGEKGDDIMDGGSGDDLLDGGDREDTITGGLGNDTLKGGDNDDILIGVDPTASQPGLGEIDILTGDDPKDDDLFVLGDGSWVYYQGGNEADYALITDFDDKDMIQLNGSAGDYALGTSPAGLPSGTAIFLTTGNTDDLIGIVQGTSELDLSDDKVFSFV